MNNSQMQSQQSQQLTLPQPQPKASRRGPKGPLPEIVIKPTDPKIKVINEVIDILKHTTGDFITKLYGELDKSKDDLIIDMDYAIRYVGDRIILEVFGYQTKNDKIKLKKPFIFYRSSGKSRGDGIENMYFPSCLGQDDNNYIVSIRTFINDFEKKQKFISYSGLEVTIPSEKIPLSKYPETILILLCEKLILNLQEYNLGRNTSKNPEYKELINSFITNSNYVNQKFTKDLTTAINGQPMLSRPLDYFEHFDITINSILEYGRLINKEIALISKWLFDNNETIVLQSFIYNFYYMKSTLEASYDYESMIESMDEINAVDNEQIFRYKYKDKNWFYSYCNELFSTKTGDNMYIKNTNITIKKHRQAGGYRNIKYTKKNKKY